MTPAESRELRAILSEIHRHALNMAAGLESLAKEAAHIIALLAKAHRITRKPTDGNGKP